MPGGVASEGIEKKWRMVWFGVECERLAVIFCWGLVSVRCFSSKATGELIQVMMCYWV